MTILLKLNLEGTGTESNRINRASLSVWAVNR